MELLNTYKQRIPRVEVTIPVFNEEVQLASSVDRLCTFVQEHCRFDFRVVIVDNGSTDGTWKIARKICATNPAVHGIHLCEKGRGRALKRAWMESDADVLCYTDVDLSTDLHALPPMVEALLSGGFQLAAGSRLLKPAQVVRGFKREVISRSYNLLVRASFHTRFSDAQCGFKAITRRAALELLPHVEDTGWFFDTELLILAEKAGHRIFDLPVQWIDDPDSRVNIVSTAWSDIKGLFRLRRNSFNGKYGSLKRITAYPENSALRDGNAGTHQRTPPAIAGSTM